MHHPTDRIAHTMAFVTPLMEHWLEREIAQWVNMNEYKQLMKFNVFICKHDKTKLVHRQ